MFDCAFVIRKSNTAAQGTEQMLINYYWAFKNGALSNFKSTIFSIFPKLRCSFPVHLSVTLAIACVLTWLWHKAFTVTRPGQTLPVLYTLTSQLKEKKRKGGYGRKEEATLEQQSEAPYAPQLFEWCCHEYESRSVPRNQLSPGP